tara:strand:- start:692 stop:1042 length:351 start_codon:yes stop_codon:yes gene_type:complete
MRIILLVLCLLVPASVSAQEKAYTASEWAVLVGHSFDTASTQNCLGRGVCREVNPWLARYRSPVGFTAAKASVTLAQLWAMRRLKEAGHPRAAMVANYVIGAGFMALGIRNERLTR